MSFRRFVPNMLTPILLLIVGSFVANTTHAQSRERKATEAIEQPTHLPNPATAPQVATAAAGVATAGWALAIHGGAGTGEKLMTPHLEAAYNAGLQRSLAAGAVVLSDGGSAVDAVEAAVRVLEDDPLFNAGRGAVMTIDGTFELDASIMDGSNLEIGGVAGLRQTSNPISVARRVMDQTDHVLLIGPAADRFAIDQGFGTVTQEYFFTPRHFEAIQKRRAELNLPPLPNPAKRASEGTVGAVARDSRGNLAAATSTGGRTGKMSGRVGDSPIAGAGTYAENKVVAVSATGIGEQFIRHSAAAQIAWFVKHAGMTIDAATQKVMFEILSPGDGGLIAIGPSGPPIIKFSTPAMSRGTIDASGQTMTSIGGNPPPEP
jgi:beta-aspartyl-peptidase (threonine type)